MLKELMVRVETRSIGLDGKPQSTMSYVKSEFEIEQIKKGLVGIITDKNDIQVILTNGTTFVFQISMEDFKKLLNE